MTERSRGAQKRVEGGVRKGFGSFYGRKPGQYSVEEFAAARDNPDRVRTADLDEDDKIMRQEKGDDSERESDWFDRTGINPAEYTKSNKKAKHADKNDA